MEHLPWNDFVFEELVLPGLIQFALPLLLFFRVHFVHVIAETYIKLSLHGSHDQAEVNPR